MVDQAARKPMVYGHLGAHSLSVLPITYILQTRDSEDAQTKSKQEELALLKLGEGEAPADPNDQT